MIPHVPQIAAQPRPLNDRLWELHRKCADRTISAMETVELDCLCQALESDQDNLPEPPALPTKGEK